VGSANLGRDTRNPFLADERLDILKASLAEDTVIYASPTWVRCINDHPYDNNKWIAQVQTTVADFAQERGLPPNYTVAITGHDRDESVLYKKFFPQWAFLPPKTAIPEVNATAFRKEFYEGNWESNPAFTDLPGPSMRFLENFSKTDTFKQIVAEWEFEKQYRIKWGPGPFLTVDNVVVKSGHVLVVKRKNLPGKGRLALPGGHLERNETLDHGAVRELWEETQIFTYGINPSDMFSNDELVEITKESIWPHFRERKIFDKVNRSLRARVITEAFLFKLPDLMEFPKVIGTDDAELAFWMPLSDIKPADFFEDHAFIIDKMLGYL
jgi:bifunctional NMN adenylyltransferase/nudix hydrolase